MAMGAEAIKPLASLDAAMLGRRPALRRVPLSFAPAEAATAIPDCAATDVPEVVRQLERLARAFEHDSSTDQSRSRIACTVRFDAARHGRLRSLAAARECSAQQVLVDAFDRFSAAATDVAAIPSHAILPRKTSTGSQS